MSGIIVKRTLAVIVILIATIAFLADAAGLVGVWVIRRPACHSVSKLSTFVDEKLGKIDQLLGRVSARADDGRQALALVSNAASELDDRPQESRPLLTTLTDAARENLAPKIADILTQAAALHDSVVSVNGVLETVDSLGFVNVPTFSDELAAVSERIDALQDDVRELRLAIDEGKAGATANLTAAIRARTVKIEDVMAQIQSTAARYQTTVAEKRQQVSDLGRRLVRIINLLALLLTALLLVIAAGQVLLVHVCWRYVREVTFGLVNAHTA